MKKQFFPALFTVLFVSIAMLPFPVLSTEVAVLFKQDLTDISGKAGLMLTVEYAPGESSPRIAIIPIRSSMSWKAPS